MRILALDWGTKRIGGAISDETGTIAFPLDKFFESGGAVEEIIRMVSEKGVEKIIIGNPVSLTGEASESSQKVSKFVEQLKKKIPIPIELIDERFSSKAAQQALTEQGINQKAGREAVDNIAAQQMLQQYLKNNN